MDVLGLACDESDRAHAVAANVHQRAAVELGVEARVTGAAFPFEREAERGADEPQRADSALREQCPELRRLRVVAPHEALGEHQPGGVGATEALLHLVPVPRERLLDTGRASRPRARGASTRRAARSGSEM